MPTNYRSKVPALAAAMIAWWAATLNVPCRAQTTVFVVRHAEQTDASAQDPGLSDAGRRRVSILTQMLESVKLTVIFASEFQRTLQTVQPVADAHNVDVTRYRARETGGLAERIRAKHQGETLLVAGHSNTVGVLLLGLGVDPAEVPKIEHDDFDDLFIVFIDAAGDVKLHHLRYGGSAGAAAPEQARPAIEQQTPEK